MTWERNQMSWKILKKDIDLTLIAFNFIVLPAFLMADIFILQGS
jgi:hypothetical protein